MKTIHLFLASFCALILCGCSDLLNPKMTRYATTEQIDELKNTNPDAVITVTNALIQGIYAYTNVAQNTECYGISGHNAAADLMTEDIVQFMYHWHYTDYDFRARALNQTRTRYFWMYCYTSISQANEVIDKIDFNTTESALKFNLGQALAMRGLAYLMLIQRYQQTYKGNENKPGVPIYITKKEGENVLTRGTVQGVYDQILSDLNKAHELLAGMKRTDKGAVNQQVSAGFLARVHMVLGNWKEAEFYAKAARAGFTLMPLSTAGTHGYNDLSNSECMWGVDITPLNRKSYASIQSHFCSTDAGYGGKIGAYKMIDKRLLDQMGANDVRRKLYFINGEKNSEGIAFPFATNNKFKKVDGWCSDMIYMRSSEMLLIEAEALAQQNKNSEAAIVLAELMMQRDPDWNKSSVIVEDIFLQKRLEMWGEGVIFYDYMRLKKGINRNYPGTNHTITLDLQAGDWKFIYQIPSSEMDNNQNFTSSDQNP